MMISRWTAALAASSCVAPQENIEDIREKTAQETPDEEEHLSLAYEHLLEAFSHIVAENVKQPSAGPPFSLLANNILYLARQIRDLREQKL